MAVCGRGFGAKYPAACVECFRALFCVTLWQYEMIRNSRTPRADF